MAQEVIAIVCDCDDTLCPDTASTLVRAVGLDPVLFWREVNADVENGWDPPLAWLTHLIERSRSGAIAPLTRELIQAVGASIEPFEGVTDFIPRIRERLASRNDFRESGITVEWYIVSSGIEELLRATPIAGLATSVYGSRLAYDARGVASGVKASVTFTEKTKFIYAINKGISAEELYRQPYRVNDAVEQEHRRIPFKHMIYLGDGPSDIPCFSMLKTYGGSAIGVIPPADSDLRKPYELATGRRLTVGPYSADYRPTSDLFRMLQRVVEGIADDIVIERAQHLRGSPRF